MDDASSSSHVMYALLPFDLSHELAFPSIKAIKHANITNIQEIDVTSSIVLKTCILKISQKRRSR